MTIININEGEVMMLVSMASLSMLCLLCLKCKKANKIIREEASIYDPQIFQRGGSRFAVTRSKTVTRPNQMTTQNQAETKVTQNSQAADEDYTYVIGDQDQDNVEPTYVAPLSVAVYGNIDKIQEVASASNLCDYENVLTNMHSNDDDDYENSEFLQNIDNLADDPDYVNADQ